MDNEALVLDFLEWVAAAPRRYQDVMRAWRTTCPRLTIWEDALDAGLVRIEHDHIAVTDSGRRLLAARAATPAPRDTAAG